MQKSSVSVKVEVKFAIKKAKQFECLRTDKEITSRPRKRRQNDT